MEVYTVQVESLDAVTNQLELVSHIGVFHKLEDALDALDFYGEERLLYRNGNIFTFFTENGNLKERREINLLEVK